jgi:ABC-2 type transport system ATP-binding protein
VNLLEVNHLAKSYGDTEAVRDLSFILPAGYIMGLVGPDGAGKTTALKLMLGLLTPTAGAVQVLGMDPTRRREAVLRATGSMIEVPVFWERLRGGRGHLDNRSGRRGWAGR